MEKATLLQQLDETTVQLQEALSGLSPEAFNNPRNGWSPAQVLEHLLILDGIALKAMTLPAIPTNRPHDEKLPMIRTVMDDRTTKRSAPEIVMPSHEKKDFRQLMEAFRMERNALKKAVEASELSEACTAFKHPGMGTLTKLEWIVFTIHHTQRHTAQVKDAKEPGPVY